MGGYSLVPFSFGSTAEPYDGKWQPHWGVDIVPYATSGKIALLTSYNMINTFTVTCTNSYVVKVYGKNGLIETTTLISGSKFTYNQNFYSDFFDDAGDGYKTNIITVEPLTGVLLTFNHRLTEGFYSGMLWLKNNSSSCSFGAFDTTSGRNPLLECFDVSVGVYSGTNCMNGQTNLIKATGLNGTSIGTALFANCNSLRESDMMTNVSSAQNRFLNCYNLRFVGLQSFVNNTITTMNGCFYNCWALAEDINITSATLTNFGANNDMRSVPSITINAPLTLFVVNNAYSCKSISLTNTNFRSAANGTVLNVTNCYNLDCTNLIAQIAANEAGGSLVGKVFVITGTLNAATVDITPITNLGGGVTR